MSLKDIRIKNRISQALLARTSGVSQTTISRIEAGKEDCLRMANAHAIVAGLNKLEVECSFFDVFPAAVVS